MMGWEREQSTLQTVLEMEEEPRWLVLLVLVRVLHCGELELHWSVLRMRTYMDRRRQSWSR